MLAAVQPIQSGAMLSAKAAAQRTLGKQTSSPVAKATKFQVLVRNLAGQELKVVQPESLEALKMKVTEHFGLPTLVQSLVSNDGVALAEEQFQELSSDSQWTVLASLEGVKEELSDPAGSSRAIEALGTLVERGAGPAAAAVDVISEKFESFQSSQIRQEVSTVLEDAARKGIHGAVDLAVSLASHSDAQVRLAMVKGLTAELLEGNAQAAEVITKGVYDSSAEVQREALDAVSKIASSGDEAAVTVTLANYQMQSAAAQAARDRYLMRTLDFRSMTGIGSRTRFSGRR